MLTPIAQRPVTAVRRRGQILIPRRVKGDPCIGAEVVPDPDLHEMGAWALSAWSHDAVAGELSLDGSQGGNVSAVLPDALVVGQAYRVEWEIKSLAAGNVRILCGGAAGEHWQGAAGRLVEYITCGAVNDNLQLQADADFSGVVSFISCRDWLCEIPAQLPG